MSRNIMVYHRINDVMNFTKIVSDKCRSIPHLAKMLDQTSAGQYRIWQKCWIDCLHIYQPAHAICIIFSCETVSRSSCSLCTRFPTRRTAYVASSSSVILISSLYSVTPAWCWNVHVKFWSDHWFVDFLISMM